MLPEVLKHAMSLPFPVSVLFRQEENGEAFQIIEVQVLSNWGHEEYTCMYRFRVHGTPGDV